MSTQTSPECIAEPPPLNREKMEKFPFSAHVLCGWPLVLVVLGGLIGGVLGGASYSINVVIYKSKLHIAAKILLNLMVGIAAFILWMLLAVAVQIVIGK